MSSAYPYYTLVVPFRMLSPSEAQRLDIRLIQPPTYPLRPIIPDNAWATRITAAAGTSFAGPYSWGTVNKLLPP
jgi:hypothetical protein